MGLFWPSRAWVTVCGVGAFPSTWGQAGCPQCSPTAPPLLLTGVLGAPRGFLFCRFQCIACRVCIKLQFGRNPCGMRLKINGSASHFIFPSIWLVPEYPTVSWDLQFNSDTRICKRWLMNMRFQGRSLLVTWDLCRDSYYTFPPLPACFRRNMNHQLKASCICKSAET